MTATTATTQGGAARSDTGFFGHSWGLANIFGLEMWERFSFYGMQAILMYYLYYSAAQGGLGIAEASATSVMGAYGGAVYLSAILGAWVADRILGTERTLFYSAVLVMCGHIALSLLPGMAGVATGLVCVATGSGGIKATSTALIGKMYGEHDERRDAGFTIFYMGINIGSLVGPLLTGLLQATWGFRWGFGLAAVCMAIGLTQYIIFRRNLAGLGDTAVRPLPPNRRLPWVGAAVAVAAVVAIALKTGWVRAADLSDIATVVIAIAAVGLFTMIVASKQITAVERSRMKAFVPMFLASVAFWALYGQQFTTIAMFSDKELNRNLFGWEVPAAWVQSINPVFIIVFAGMLATLWTRLGPRQPSTPAKFATANVLMGTSFLMFLPIAGHGPNSAPMTVMILILLVLTIAELFISPVGMSLSTKLAPKAFGTQMVALYYLSVAMGTSLSGTLSGYYNENDEGTFFLWMGALSIAVGVVVAVLIPWIKKMMAGLH